MTDEALRAQEGQPLTRREREIMALAIRGFSDRQIADELHLSVRTVEGHLYRSYVKLKIKGREDLAGVVIEVSMTDEECLGALGQLALEARTRTGRNRQWVATQMGLGYHTLGRFEQAKNKGDGVRPKRPTLQAIEIFYGWKPGVLEEIWDNRKSLHIDDVTEEMLLPQPENQGAMEARHLTDAQLMAELQFRFLMRDPQDAR